MAYDQNLLRLVSHGIADGTATSANVKLPSFYVLQSAVDNIAAMVAVGYITNARQMGLKVGDIVNLMYYPGTGVPQIAIATVAAINATTGAGDLSDATTVATTNAT
jgi:hypothetical protein